MKWSLQKGQNQDWKNASIFEIELLERLSLYFNKYYMRCQS